MTKFWRATLLLACLAGVQPASARLNSRTAWLESRATPGGWKTLDYCIDGDCNPLLRESGYSVRAWTTMARVCRTRAVIDPSVINNLEMVLVGTAAMIGPIPAGIGFVGAAIAGDFVGTPDMHEAAESIQGLLNNGSWYLSPDLFVAIKNGVTKCANYYESHTSLWLADCDQDRQCKLDLAKDLHWGDEAAVLATPAAILWNARQEISRAHDMVRNRPHAQD